MIINYLLLVVFYGTVFLCVGSYVLYPLFIFILCRLKTTPIQKSDFMPPVSIIISAYNESNDIERKIKNTFALDYPKEKMEILIGSDGSTDNTAAIIRRFIDKGIIFYDYKKNRGKTTVQNDLVAKARNEILVFTDAASFLPKDALKKIVRSFWDKRVGCVAGRMRFVNTDKNVTTQSQGIYWKYEVKVRSLEAAIGRLIGVDGPLYAVKKENYVPLKSNIISDLMTPLLVLGQGKRVVLEPEAFVDEEPKEKSSQEFDTRRRITLRGMIGIFSHPQLLNPLRYPLVSFQILFHKVIRWGVGFFVSLNFLACIGLAMSSSIFQYVLMSYGVFCLAALIGWLAAGGTIKLKIISIPYYFCLVNFAATMGIIDFFKGKQAVTWNTVR